MSKIILTDEQYKEYQDTEACFGSTEEGMSFDLSIPECKKCPDKELCEQLFNVDVDTKIINSATADVAEVYCDEPEEKTKEVVNEKTTFEYTRETLTESLIMMGKKEGIKFDVTGLKTRSKVFEGDIQRFTISDKTLRVIGISDGKALGLKPKDFEEKASGIVIELTNTKAIKNVIKNYNNNSEPEETDGFTGELNLGEPVNKDAGTVVGKVEPTDTQKENVGKPQLTYTDKPTINNLSITKPEFNRNLIGGIGVKVYSDDTVEISTVCTKKRFEIGEVMEKMKELLESYLK